MKHSGRITRGITISIFVILISGFVAYRAGLFDKAGPATENPDEVLKPGSRSLPLTDDQPYLSPGPESSQQSNGKTKNDDSFTLHDNEVMSGSKSLILMPVVRNVKPARVPRTQKVKVDSFYLDEEEVMGSSKSGRIHIFKPDTGSKNQE
jgi:hypothetical protein